MDTPIVRKKPNSSSPNIIDNLPDECISKIFSFVICPFDRCSCCLVSKKWLHLLANVHAFGFELPVESSPLEPFSRRLMGKKANDTRLAALAVRACPPRVLTSLSLIGMPSSVTVTDSGLAVIARASPCLKSLFIWDCKFVGDAGVRSIGQWCRELERLSLNSLPLVSNNGLLFIANSCLKLSGLSIGSCPLIGNESMEAIASKLMKLNSISIAKCPLVEDSGIVSLVSNLPQLKKLKLEMMKIGDEVLRAIRDYARALNVLQLEKIDGPTATGYSLIQTIEELISLKMRLSIGLTGESLKWASERSFAKLKELEIQRCGSFTDEVLIDLSKSAKELKFLRLEECGGFTSKGLMEALSNWRETLEQLSFYKCSIIEVSTLVPRTENLHCLTTLELRQCSGIEDGLLTWLGYAYNQLQHVSLVGMNSFTDQGLLHLFINIRNPDQLASLDFSGCTTVSPRAVHSILKSFGAGLQTLKLGRCSGVNDWVMAVITKHCVALKELNIEGCGVSDISLWCLVNMGEDRVQSLRLAGCEKITDEGLKYLEDMTWDNMRLLDVRNCPRVTDRGVGSFEEMIWWCKVVW